MRAVVAFRIGGAMAALGVLAWLASLCIVSYRTRGGSAAALTHGELWVTNGPTYFSPGLNVLSIPPTPVMLQNIQWWPEYGWVHRQKVTGVGIVWSVHCPLWVPVALGAGMMGIAGAVDRRRLPGPQCARCGYSLLGIAGVCPECGAQRAAGEPLSSPREPGR